MSQADLAGTAFSKSFISLVEHGKTRMSLRAAELIASRLGSSVVDLLADVGDAAVETQLLRAQAQLHDNDIAPALTVLDGLARRVHGPMLGRVQQLRGNALLRAGRPVEALTSLDAALRELRTAGDQERAARTLFDLAVVHARLDRVNEAIHFALETERAISDRRIVDRTLELQVLSFLAASFVRIGDFESADIRAHRAVELAQDIADPRAVARLYSTLSLAREEQGDHEAALTYARRSLALYDSLGARAAVASMWNTIAWVFVRRAQPGKASEALDQAERLARADGDGPLLAVCLQTRAELEIERGNVPAALGFIDESLAHPDVSARARAEGLLIRAQAVAKSGASLAAVNRAFATAIQALKPEGRRALARAHQAHFEALVARGKHVEAVNVAQEVLRLMRPAGV